MIELTCRGNPKPPSDEVVCTWVKTAWRNVDRDVIKKNAGVLLERVRYIFVTYPCV